jgi:hypothetical protein
VPIRNPDKDKEKKPRPTDRNSVVPSKGGSNYEFRYSAHDPKAEPIDIWNTDSPLSIFNKVTPALRDAIKQIPPRLFTLQPTRLRHEGQIAHTDDELRQAFWSEYWFACDEGRPMRLTAVYGQIISKQTFFENYVSNPFRMAWILRPPENYTYRMQSLLEMGLQRLYDVLNFDLDKKDTKLISEVVKIVALLDNRVKGAVTQRVQIQTENKHLHAHMTAGEQPKSYMDINKELKQIDEELKQLAASSGSARLEGIMHGGGRGEPEAIEVEARGVAVNEGEAEV